MATATPCLALCMRAPDHSAFKCENRAAPVSVGWKRSKLVGKAVRAAPLSRRQPSHRLASQRVSADLAISTGDLLKIGGGLGVGFFAYKTYVYTQLQYITAAIIGNHVPKGGARVVELGIGQGRNLYYYPKDVFEVNGSGPGNEGILMQTAVATNIVLDLHQWPASKMDVQSNSVDAVVSVGALATEEDRPAVVAEAARVLKPGSPFIFVEPLAAAAQETLQTIQSCPALQQVTVDEEWAGKWSDAHAIGVAYAGDVLSPRIPSGPATKYNSRAAAAQGRGGVSRRSSLVAALAGAGAVAGACVAAAPPASAEEQSPLVAELLRKSAENKAKNDAERQNYDKQYSSYMGILKAGGYVPEDEESRKKMGVERPPECNLPVFNTSPVCLAFDAPPESK